MISPYMCQARGCGARAAAKSDVWCPRHRRILLKAQKGLCTEIEEAMRDSREWREIVRKAQDLIVTQDADAARQQEMFHGDS